MHHHSTNETEVTHLYDSFYLKQIMIQTHFNEGQFNFEMNATSFQ